MSNFMHKFKDAVTDRHDQDSVPPNEAPGAQSAYKPTNPYAKDSAPTQNNPSMNDEFGPEARRGIGNTGAARVPDTGSATTGTSTTNAGPHNSKLGNKMDPRVDSDLDHRAQNPRTMGAQNTVGARQAMNTGDMAPSGHPRTYGTDNHAANEDNYNKATQEHNRHSEPGAPGSGVQFTSEDNSSSSTQEHKSHTATTHATPCEMNPRAEPGLQGGVAQPEFGGGAAGGSSYTQPPVRDTAGMQNPNRMGKVDPQAQGMGGYPQNEMGNQRSGY
ncbi:uncharacterized protein N7458_003858 [Penicillium daleae]|uniref:Uncharacterized protein n=1 Tax=Penicillium daleae TaxID=63821 RepID=A0AAD6C930_9EURO|nr:uncharacterized protein N7458_003858 [Penicillium daleae]KAJ5455594.1 hypothetical protein N7458_003858 [Penicillium daleae]